MASEKRENIISLITYKHSILCKVVACLLIFVFTITDVTYGYDKVTFDRIRAIECGEGIKEVEGRNWSNKTWGHKLPGLKRSLWRSICRIFFIFSLVINLFISPHLIAQEVPPRGPVRPSRIELKIPLLSKSTTTYIKKENGNYYLYINNVKAIPFIGIVYQPVPDGKHINDYKNNLALLYKALLDENEGGQGHAKLLHNMGIRYIRIYQFDSENEEDVAKLKQIFRAIFQQYKIRVLIGSYIGLYDNIDYNNVEEIGEIRNILRKTVHNFCREPWVLGWGVGNENNLHLIPTKYLPQIDLSKERYFNIMDLFAGTIKATLEAEKIHQIVLLGNGDLSPEEIVLMSKMKNIDGLGINCYRDPENTDRLISHAREHLPLPLLFTEIGAPSIGRYREKGQAEYLRNMLEIVYKNIPEVWVNGNVIGAFICEATDQRWKIDDTGRIEEGYLGILGKRAERAIKNFSEELIWLRKYFIPKDSSEFFVSKAWEALLKYDYITARKIAQRCIAIYYNEALGQQEEYRTLPEPLKTKEEITKFWALNDVATSYYIVGRSWYEINMKPQAKETLDVVLHKFPDAHIMDRSGKYWKVTQAIKKIFPDLYAPKIMLPVPKIILIALIGTWLLTYLHLIKKFFRIRIKQLDYLRERIKKINIATAREIVTHSGLVFVSLFCLAYLASWWFHPVRMEYYIVSPALFWLLSYIAIFTTMIYLFVWRTLSTMERPIYISPPRNKRVAMVTTYVPADSIELITETLKNMVCVHYPHDTYVLDESDDSELKRICRELGVIHFSRRGLIEYNTPGGKFKTRHKAGNLNSWIYTFGHMYKFVTFLDPDHQPKPEYLDRVLGYFADSEVGFVQAPQIYRNQEESWIARGAAEQSYYYYGPLLTGYFGQGSAMVNGSHSTFRIEALLDIDGYAVHNADDMLTSLKMLAKKWKGVYVPEVLAEGLAPADWNAYLKQHLRWSHSMFDLLLYHFPKYIFKLKFRQFLPYLICGIYYLTTVNFFILLLMPIVSVIINQPPVNLELIRFLKFYIPALLSQYLILVGWGQRYLIKPKTESGLWWRGGFLAIAASPYIAYAFIRALLKRSYPRPTTPKTSPSGISYIRLFIPHLIILSGSIYALIRAYITEPLLWQTKGMKLFLCLSIISITGLIITSTKWFLNRYDRWKQERENRESPFRVRLRNFIQNIQFQGTGIMHTSHELNPRFQAAFDRCI